MELNQLFLYTYKIKKNTKFKSAVTVTLQFNSYGMKQRKAFNNLELRIYNLELLFLINKRIVAKIFFLIFNQ